MKILINREKGYWLFADQLDQQEIGYVCIDKDGNHIRRGNELTDLQTFLAQKESEGFEKF